MKNSSITIPAFVICLDREIDRRKRIQDHLESFEIAFTFAKAIDGRELSTDEKEKCYLESRAVKARGRALAAGEIGCFLSHSRLWQRMVDENINTALVIESDAVFTNEAIHVINKIDQNTSRWDLIMLYYRECHPAFKNRRMLTNQSKLVMFSNKSACTCAYLLTLEGAKKLLRQAYPIQMPVDDYMTGGYINKDMCTFAVYPRTIDITDDALETSSIREDLFPMLKSQGIKRRLPSETNTFKEIEKKLRRFKKKLFPPTWL